MDYKWIGWAGTVFLGLTLINGMLGGLLITATDIAILNQTGLTQKVDIGFMTIPVPNFQMIQGVMHLFTFDYSFFGGMAQLILFGLYSVTLMLAFMFLITVIGLGINAIRGR